MADLYQQQIRRIIRHNLPDPAVRIILFGSRATGKANALSDYDIALKSEKPLPASKLRLIREQLEASTIPFMVDVVNYAQVSSELQSHIDKDGITW